MRRLAAVGVLAIAVSGCGGSAPTAQRVVSLHAPQCTTVARPGTPLTGVTTRLEPVGPTPFGVVTAPGGGWSFVSSPGSGVSVLSDATFPPHLVRRVSLPRADVTVGAALTPDGRYLLAADRGGAVVLSVAALQEGGSHPVLGVMQPSGREGGGAIEVIASPDGRYAFVTLEGAGEVAVFDLHRALASGFRGSGFVGYIRVGIAPVGMAISPDGRRLYVTSEIEGGARLGGPALRGTQGTLTVIDLHRGEVDPASAVVTTVTAGCEPVRVTVSPDGRTVWVTARASDRLLGFDAARLTGSRPGNALVADVPVGEAPVGLALVDGGKLIVVADSNRFDARGAHAALTVVSTTRALAGKSAVLGSLPAGGFPREMSLEPGGDTLLVTNFISGQLEAVDVGEIHGPG